MSALLLCDATADLNAVPREGSTPLRPTTTVPLVLASAAGGRYRLPVSSVCERVPLAFARKAKSLAYALLKLVL